MRVGSVGCRHLAAACLFVGLVIATPSRAAAQDWSGQGRVEGRVLDPDGKPVEGASVTLANPERGGGPQPLKTDRKGKWAYLGIVAGKWNLDVEAAGFETKKGTFTLPAESARIPPMEVRLEKPAQKGTPPEVLAALDKAESAYKEERFEEAVAEFEKLLALRPDLAKDVNQRIGFACIRLKQYEKALQHLQQVLDADPSNQSVRAIMAQAALEGGLVDRAVELLKGLPEGAIKDPDVLFNIAVSFLNANRPQDAIVYFGQAIAVDPTYADGYFRRGLAHIQVGRNAEARADLQKLLELRPEGAEADLARKALEQVK